MRTRAPFDALPNHARCVLLLVDFINPFDFPGAVDLAQPLQTPLEPLLTQMETRELVVNGLATNLCVQISAMDFLRGYRLWVPEDRTAAETFDQKRQPLDWMAHGQDGRIDRARSGRCGHADCPEVRRRFGRCHPHPSS